MIAEDEFGLLDASGQSAQPMTKDERLVASFDEITRLRCASTAASPTSDAADVAEMQARHSGWRDCAQTIRHARRSPTCDDELGLAARARAARVARGGDCRRSARTARRRRPKTSTSSATSRRPTAQPDKIAQRKPCEDFERLRAALRTLPAGAADRDPEAGSVPERAGDHSRRVLRAARRAHLCRRGRRAAQGGERAHQRAAALHLRERHRSGSLLRSFASQLYRFGKQVTDPEEKTLARSRNGSGRRPLGGLRPALALRRPAGGGVPGPAQDRVHQSGDGGATRRRRVARRPSSVPRSRRS